MREILFRGKRIDNGMWVIGWYFEYQDMCVILPLEAKNSEHTYLFDYAVEVDPETVSQYIGITDEIYTNIFEGDIVVVDTEDGHKAYLVCFAESEDENTFISGFMGKYLFDAIDCDSDDKPYFLVIGNIHDNPVLCKEGTINVK